jgi:hypothetical protein
MAASTAVRFVVWLSDVTSDDHPPANIVLRVAADDVSFTRSQFNGRRPPSHMEMVDSSRGRYAFGFIGMDTLQVPGGCLWITVTARDSIITNIETLSMPESVDQLEIMETAAGYVREFRNAGCKMGRGLRERLSQVFKRSVVDTLERRAACGQDVFASWPVGKVLLSLRYDSDIDVVQRGFRTGGFDAVIIPADADAPAPGAPVVPFAMTVDGWKIGG